MAAMSGQTVAHFAKEEAIRNQNYAGCVAAEVLSKVFPIPLDLYKSKSNEIRIPTIEISLTACQGFEKPPSTTSDFIYREMDSLVGPILGTMQLYSVEVSCKEQIVTEEFLDFLYSAEKEISDEMKNPNGQIVLEGRSIDLSACKE